MPPETKQRATVAQWPSEEERFADRREAGRALAAALAERFPPSRSSRPLVLGLPRGGVPVAQEIAKLLDADLDVVVTRKVGLPWQPEYGIGAVAGDGPAVFDRNALANAGMAVTALAPMVRRERLEVQRREQQYRGNRPAPTVAGRTVVIADDGMATSVAARAAVRAIRAGSPARILYAAPVCAAEAADWLRTEADEVLHLHSPRVFHALGLWYHDLPPVTDDDVTRILSELCEPSPPRPVRGGTPRMARAGTAPTTRPGSPRVTRPSTARAARQNPR